MKKELIEKLTTFKMSLRALKKDVSALRSDRVSQKAIKAAVDAIVAIWVEELRSPLEYKIGLSNEVIESTAAHINHLCILSRPNNLKTSYLKTINAILSHFDDKFILPVQQTALSIDVVLDLRKLISGLLAPDESDYMKEAIECASSGHRRAAIVMGWCAAIDKIQCKLMDIGLDKFSQACSRMKGQTSGRFKRFNKEFSGTTLSELQTVFDTDLIRVLEGMSLIDSNQADHLEICFQYRNHSAHPGQAPLEDAHLIVFFTDILAIVLQNPRFQI